MTAYVGQLLKTELVYYRAIHIRMFRYFVGFALQYKHAYRNMRVRLALNVARKNLQVESNHVDHQRDDADKTDRVQRDD